MYSKDMLIGIILSKFKFYIDVSVDETRKIGYKTRIFANCYGSREFIFAIDRSLQQNGICARWNVNTSYEKPRKSIYCLTISQINRLSKLMSLLPIIPNAKNDLELVREAILLVNQKKHLELKGLERIIQIKEMMKYGINDNEQ